jgi:hypothetical protein
MGQNKVALCLKQPIPKLVDGVGTKSYYFDVQHSVSLCWVDEEDVGLMLSLKGGCCGGKSPLCHRATEGEIRIFTVGHY